MLELGLSGRKGGEIAVNEQMRGLGLEVGGFSEKDSKKEQGWGRRNGSEGVFGGRREWY